MGLRLRLSVVGNGYSDMLDAKYTGHFELSKQVLKVETSQEMVPATFLFLLPRSTRSSALHQYTLSRPLQWQTDLSTEEHQIHGLRQYCYMTKCMDASSISMRCIGHGHGTSKHPYDCINLVHIESWALHLFLHHSLFYFAFQFLQCFCNPIQENT